jgi:hypothetical protein
MPVALPGTRFHLRRDIDRKPPFDYRDNAPIGGSPGAYRISIILAQNRLAVSQQPSEGSWLEALV